MKTSLSLYIHIPFCRAFCDYCDFYSVDVNKVSEDYIKKYLYAVVTDIKNQIEYFNVGKIPTVYIGGGTPSVLGRNISILLDILNNTGCAFPQEITVEANPESLTEEFLSVCRDGGVNRLSLGVQTFHEPSRKAVSRIGDASLLGKQIALARKYFGGSNDAGSPCHLSMDLITGLPFQTEKIVIDDVKRLMEFDPAHVSLYSLTIENETPLEEKIKSKSVILPKNDEADSLWLSARDELKKTGFQHYEVSNFARKGQICLHNIRYWRMEGWMGAGNAASGTIINEETASAKRYTYAPDVNAYVNNPSIHAAVCEELDKSSLMRDFLLMGYRYHEGPDKKRFKKIFGSDIEECIPKTLARWKDRDIMLFLNSFLSEAFEELE